ncbi:MAG TPA: hypothetical protein PK313_11810, partial [Myxococcota bacterium]|nr:hypothetical protein [Myxococcota bacterium]
MDRSIRDGRSWLTLIPTTAGRRRLAMVAVAVLAGFLHVDLVRPLALRWGAEAYAQAPASGARSLGIVVVPRKKGDETAAMVVRGLLRGVSDRMVG